MDTAKTVYLENNINCNLKCSHCDIHLLKNPKDALSLNEKIELIRALAHWNEDIKLSFSGGEPLLVKKDLLSLIREASSLGLHTSINTNGTLFREGDYSLFASSGLRSVIFSLDSHKEELHDSLRGVPGTFQRVSASITEMLSAIKKTRAKCSVVVSAILGKHNILELKELVEYSLSIGADGLIFQALQAPFERNVETNWWKEDPMWPENHEWVNEGIDSLIRLKDEKYPLFQPKEDFENIRNYFLFPRKIPSGICQSMNQNLMVDILGNVSFCFNMDSLGEPSLGNIRNENIRDIWESSRQIAKKWKSCSKPCALMLCHSSCIDALSFQLIYIFYKN